MGLPKGRNAQGNGVFVVPAQKKGLNTSVVAFTEGEGKQSKTDEGRIPVKNGSTANIKKVQGIYQKLIQVTELKRAYESVSKKESANTKGVTDATLDVISEARMLALYKELKSHSFKFKPIRRTYIPKKDGSKRPLGIPGFIDKVVLKAGCNVLEGIYEGKGIFLECSHGFRPGKSPHSALFQIKG